MFGGVEGGRDNIQQMQSRNAICFKAWVGVRHEGIRGWGMGMGTAFQAEGREAWSV